jgi:tetratricopeptide (TPR) repeat protein
LTAFQKLKALDPVPWWDGNLGYAYAALGERAKAIQLLRELDELAKRRYVTPGPRVSIYLGLGETEKALDWLEKCYEEQDGTCWWLKVDPIYDGVRDHPRFKALLKKVFPDK